MAGPVADTPATLCRGCQPPTTCLLLECVVHARVDQIKDAGHGERLAALWSEHPQIPTFKKAGPCTTTELETIIGLCDQVEADTEMPFGPSDPTAEQTTKATTKRSATTNG